MNSFTFTITVIFSQLITNSCVCVCVCVCLAALLESDEITVSLRETIVKAESDRAKAIKRARASLDLKHTLKNEDEWQLLSNQVHLLSHLLLL